MSVMSPRRPRHATPRVNVPLVVVLALVLAGAFAWWARGRGLKTRIADLFRDAPAKAPLAPVALEIKPQDGEGDVRPDITIEARIKWPGTAVDPQTLSAQNVSLQRASDRSSVPVTVSERGGGKYIIIKPATKLAGNTRYALTVNDRMRDGAGKPIAAHTSTFTTGTLADPSLRFERVELPMAMGTGFTAVVMGPDYKLYAGADDGRIFRFEIGADGVLETPQILPALQNGGKEPRLLTGFCFDPSSKPGSLIVWASHGHYGFDSPPDFSGRISRLSGNELEVVQDVVVGLPRSVKDHVNNQPVIGPDEALYWPQPSNSAYGAPDEIWGNRPERGLTATILRLDLTKVTAGKPIDAKTKDAGGSYDPSAAGAPITIYAYGVRLAYDLVWASNCHLYAPVNGSSAGGHTPAGGMAPPLKDIKIAEDDWLFRIAPGKYHGHPNPLHRYFVLNGGNPTSGYDVGEFAEYPVGVKPDPRWNPPAHNFGQHISPNGIIQYQSDALGGKLKGMLMVCRYNGGSDILALKLDAAGNVSSTIVGIEGFTGFASPLDLVEDPRSGNIYISEYGAQKLTLLRPVPSK